MQVALARETLLKSLNRVRRVVEKRPTMPVLGNVRLDASEDGRLVLTTTDMDTSVCETVEANVGQAGSTTVRASVFYDIVRKLRADQDVSLSLSTGSANMVIADGAARFDLPVIDVAEFPDPVSGETPCAFSLEPTRLRDMIDRTRFAISTDETRYFLMGVYFHIASDEGSATPALRAVATDGHRLALYDGDVPEGAADMPPIIVPRKTVNEVRRLIDDVTHPVQIGISHTRIRFAFGQTVLTSKLIDGTFPDYRAVIPTGNDVILSLDKSALASALDRVVTVASAKSKALKLSAGEAQLCLSTESADTGSAEEYLECSFNGEEAVTIGFNAGYLLDIVNQIKTDVVRFRVKDRMTAVKVDSPGDPSSLFLVMPMRV